ncbi:MAG: PDZ domain-containing protein [Myxococcota bacterium]
MNRTRAAFAALVLALVLVLVLLGSIVPTSSDDPAASGLGTRSAPVAKRTPRSDPRGSAGPTDDAASEPGADEPDALSDAESTGPDGLTDAELAERAAQLAADPRTHVVCDLGLPVRHAEAYLAVGGHSDFNGRRVEIIDGTAYLPLVYDLGDLGDAVFTERSGLFSLEGYGPAAIAWSDPPGDGSKGACTAPVTPEPGLASLTGTLTLSPSGAPAAGGWVEGCGNMAFADQHGVVHMDIVPEPCVLLAMRQDGLLRTVSPPVSVTPTPGQDVVVDLVIPEAPRAGLGVRVSSDEQGIRVDEVIEGGPAALAGLEAGDHVVGIDGEPLDPDDLAEFVERAGGTPGTEVSLDIVRDGQPQRITVEREVLPG